MKGFLRASLNAQRFAQREPDDGCTMLATAMVDAKRFGPEDVWAKARLAVESGLFPIYEAEHGVVTSSRKIRRQVPVTEYLQPQRRFAHLFSSPEGSERVAKLQAIADRNILEFHLLDHEADA